MPRLLLLCSLAALLGGCAMSEEDKNFYYRGWLNPRELDEDRAPPPSQYGGPPVPGKGYKRDPLLGY